MHLPERLQQLLDDGLVESVVQTLTSGKEAKLFVVYADGDYRVAKVYKDSHERSFRHRAGYAEGRRVRNSRERRAMEKGTRYGKSKMEAAWHNAEVDALYRLSEAGVRVPKPHLYVDGVLLMEVVLDPEGGAAPRLFDVDLTEELALEIHQFLVHQLVLMLCEGLVHGDLSECNVLLAWDGPVIIDFPQATDAAHNPNARTLFIRDVENLTRYLARFAPEIGETRYCREIWSLYERSQLFPDTPLTGRFAESQRRADTRAVLREIEDAAQEARAKRVRDGDSRPVWLHTDARPDDRRAPRGPAPAKPAPAKAAPAKPAPARSAPAKPAPAKPAPARSGPKPASAKQGPPAKATRRGPEPEADFDLDDLDDILRTD